MCLQFSRRICSTLLLLQDYDRPSVIIDMLICIFNFLARMCKVSKQIYQSRSYIMTFTSLGCESGFFELISLHNLFSISNLNAYYKRKCMKVANDLFSVLRVLFFPWTSTPQCSSWWLQIAIDSFHHHIRAICAL